MLKQMNAINSRAKITLTFQEEKIEVDMVVWFRFTKSV